MDDLFAVTRGAIPRLTRSALHRTLRRHGVSRLPREPKEKGKRSKAYEIGYFHLDIAELRTAKGKAFLFVAVDRTPKLAVARLYRKATKLAAQAFLKVLVREVPYRVHTVLTDDGGCGSRTRPGPASACSCTRSPASAGRTASSTG